jgi:hypothetical protein
MTMNESNPAQTAGSRCEDGEYLHQMAIKAADQMVTAALAFQRNVAMSKVDDAATSFADMRMALIKCSTANQVWSQHLAEHGC